jgi:hypothetical protein
VRGAKLCPVSTEVRLSSPAKKNKTKRLDRENIMQYIYLLKNYTYEVISCARAHQPRARDTQDPKPCDRPRTAHKKGHLPHGSGIFPVARDTDDEWPFWYSIVLTCLALEAPSLHSNFLTAHHTCTVFLNLIFLIITFFSPFSPWNFSRANFPSCEKTVNAKV